MVSGSSVFAVLIILRVKSFGLPPDDIEDLVGELEEHEGPAALGQSRLGRQDGWLVTPKRNGNENLRRWEWILRASLQ